MTYALLGVLSIALTADAKSAPPLITPGHNQTKEFDKKCRKGIREAPRQ
jgi:hypothetical protein